MTEIGGYFTLLGLGSWKHETNIITAHALFKKLAISLQPW